MTGSILLIGPAERRPQASAVTLPGDATFKQGLADCGWIDLPDGEAARLHSMPLQAAAEPPASLPLDDAIGAVLLVDDREPNALSDLQSGLWMLASLARQGAVAIGVGHLHQGTGIGLDIYYSLLSRRNLCLPVFAVDMDRRTDIQLLLEVLVANRDLCLGVDL